MPVTVINSKADFDELISNNQIVIIDAWAAWCGPCRMISPMFEKYSENTSKVVFAKVDVDSNEDISQHLGIRSLPTFLGFKDGERVKELTGANPRGLEAMVAELDNMT